MSKVMSCKRPSNDQGENTPKISCSCDTVPRARKSSASHVAVIPINPLDGLKVHRSVVNEINSAVLCIKFLILFTAELNSSKILDLNVLSHGTRNCEFK